MTTLLTGKGHKVEGWLLMDHPFEDSVVHYVKGSTGYSFVSPFHGVSEWDAESNDFFDNTEILGPVCLAHW